MTGEHSHHHDHIPVAVTVLPSVILHNLSHHFAPPVEPGCAHGWHPANHAIFQFGNACIMLSFIPPCGTYAGLVRHSMLLMGFLLICAWGWAVLCAPDVFSWNFGFGLINGIQVFSILYRSRQVRFSDELEAVYKAVFQPLDINRGQFKKLTSTNSASVYSLDPGHHYATEGVTRTDMLALLISGTVNVVSNGHVIHQIHSNEFLDSPEYEATTNGEEKFQVSVVAATPCRYILWQRDSLNYIFVKESRLCSMMTLIIARDITNKLYSISDKVRGRGENVDIRVPCMNSILATNHLRAFLNDKPKNNVQHEHEKYY